MQAAVLTAFGLRGGFWISNHTEAKRPSSSESIRDIDQSLIIKLVRVTTKDLIRLLQLSGGRFGCDWSYWRAITHFRSEMSLLLTPGFGSYAQYHVAEESIVAVKPINLTHVERLACRWRKNRLGLPYNQKFTSRWDGSNSCWAGGVGSIAIQLAKKAMVAYILTCSAENFDFVRSWVDYQSTTSMNYIKWGETNGRDLSFSTIGGDTIGRSSSDSSIWKTCHNRRYCSLKHFLMLGVGIWRFTSFSVLNIETNWTLEKPDWTCDQIRPVIDSVLPWSDIVQAHQRLEKEECEQNCHLN